MMKNVEGPAPIVVIRRKKVVKADGHHGGAWKVAYADFVTAMMAFFLLMWLLNATTEDQRKGIADYFNPTIPISRISGGGSDGLNGSSIFSEETFAKMGTGASQARSVSAPPRSDPNMASDQTGSAASPIDSKQTADAIRLALAGEDEKLAEHLLVKVSPEGIIVEIVDKASEPLFPIGRHDATQIMDELLVATAQHLAQVRNDIQIIGHTDSLSFRREADFDNWDLSAARANTARRVLVREGINPHRIQEVAGRAARDPLIADDPSAPENRRISIVILPLRPAT